MIDTAALREKVLDLAIRGKLVPQDPNDEPASVLLERIRAEKQQMVKDGKLKPKDIKNDTIIFKGDDNLHYEQFADGTVKCIEDEIPFDIPDGWEWTRLGFLAQYKKGPFGSSITKSMFIPDSEDAIKVYEQKNAINKDTTLGNYYITKEKYESLKGFEVFPNDIIVSCAGTIGETYVMPPNMRKGIINQALMKISLYCLGMLDFYLTYFDFKLKTDANEQGYGVALKNIPPFDILKKYLVPIPPINEQQKIISEIEKAFSYIETIDNNHLELESTVTTLKSKILDLAIQGKLVPQDPNDEPASVLLERIRAEKEELIKAGKIKRNKSDSVIFKGDDNSYYENIPDNWTVCRLSELCEIMNGYAFQSKLFSKQGAPVIRISDINNGVVSLDNCSYWNDIIDDKFIVKKGDLLIALSGATTGKMGVYYHEEKAYLNQRIGNVRVKYKELLFDKYRNYFLMSLQSQILENAYGAAQPNISTKQIESSLIYLPPLAEQYRIVEAIESAFESIDKITELIA